MTPEERREKLWNGYFDKNDRPRWTMLELFDNIEREIRAAVEEALQKSDSSGSEMKFQTRYDKIDWDALIDDVRERYEYLRAAWKETETQNPELHEKMVEDLYMPAILNLADFCTSIKVDEEKPA